MANDKPELKYRRVLLKVSGEGFCALGGSGIDASELHTIAQQIMEVVALGAEVAVVVGGGNFIRGEHFSKDLAIQRATADYMGMLGTVVNGLALQDTVEKMGTPTRLLSALPMQSVCEPFVRRRAIRHLEKKRVVILAAGTGNPFVTTDTCAALRATELHADVVLKATKVDGVYSADPNSDPNAIYHAELNYQQVIDDRLKVMDLSAVDMCAQNEIPIIVFNLKKRGNIKRVISGEKVGTFIAASV